VLEDLGLSSFVKGFGCLWSLIESELPIILSGYGLTFH
ncbi:unnamed protein product, partial [Acidithrix sp. C25]